MMMMMMMMMTECDTVAGLFGRAVSVEQRAGNHRVRLLLRTHFSRYQTPEQGGRWPREARRRRSSRHHDNRCHGNRVVTRPEGRRRGGGTGGDWRETVSRRGERSADDGRRNRLLSGLLHAARNFQLSAPFRGQCTRTQSLNSSVQFGEIFSFFSFYSGWNFSSVRRFYNTRKSQCLIT